MKVKLVYFGLIAQKLGLSDEQIDLNNTDLNQLIAEQKIKYPVLGSINFKVAVNHILQDNVKIKEGDEIAFLPPFAGG